MHKAKSLMRENYKICKISKTFLKLFKGLKQKKAVKKKTLISKIASHLTNMDIVFHKISFHACRYSDSVRVIWQKNYWQPTVSIAIF